MTENKSFSRLCSHLDDSVNHICPSGDGGFWEARYVQREPHYFICYLSSHSGCQYSCRFCHLTATKQTMMKAASLDDYLQQAKVVLQTYRERLAKGMQPVTRIHFNFMARGEPLANPLVVEQSQTLFDALTNLVQDWDVEIAFNLSSIIPRDFNGQLEHIFADSRAQLFYSLYSLDPHFRKRWLPKAMEPLEALKLIAHYQRQCQKEIVFHWALIADQNDHEAQIADTLLAIQQAGIYGRFNLVRYNPHDKRHGVESSEQTLNARFAQITKVLDGERSRIVPRVGFDVQASCGMFVEPKLD